MNTYTDAANPISETSKKKILISGSGVAGIICALSLDRKKYDIDIIEQADSFRNIGFSITLWKSGFDLLKNVLATHGKGFTEGIDYFPVSAFTLFGGSVLNNLKTLDAKGFAWVIERGHLMDILESALLEKMNGRQVSFSTTITDIKSVNNKAIVSLSNGDNKEYDFVIVAEGINSTTRGMLFGQAEHIVPMNQSLRYAWFDKPTDLGKNGALFFTKSHIGVIHPPYTRNLLGYYFKNGTSVQEQKLFEVKMFGVIKSPDGTETSVDASTSHVFDLKKVYLPRYHTGNAIACIGDAAHGRPPTLGFGTSLAIEDSVLLCYHLNNANSFDNFERVLAGFSATRARRIERIYRFQDIIHKFITDSAVKVWVLSLCLKVFYAKYMEYKVKKFASYKVF